MWTLLVESSRLRHYSGLLGESGSYETDTQEWPPIRYPPAHDARCRCEHSRLAGIQHAPSRNALECSHASSLHGKRAAASADIQLQQPIAVDEKDTEGHTALMWAAYQGDGLSVELLLKHGASVETTDNAGLAPLHWAVVKGSPVCIRHLVLAGADFDARENQGKTPRDMADELKSTQALNRALEDANFDMSGRPIQAYCSPRVTNALMFIVPIFILLGVFLGFHFVSWYFAIPLALGQFYAMHYVSRLPMRLTPDCCQVSSAPRPGGGTYGQLALLCCHYHCIPHLGRLLLGYTAGHWRAGVSMVQPWFLRFVPCLLLFVLQGDCHRPRVYSSSRERRGGQDGDRRAYRRGTVERYQLLHLLSCAQATTFQALQTVQALRRPVRPSLPMGLELCRL